MIRKLFSRQAGTVQHGASLYSRLPYGKIGPWCSDHQSANDNSTSSRTALVHSTGRGQFPRTLILATRFLALQRDSERDAGLPMWRPHFAAAMGSGAMSFQ
jgi:hypothetical protein